MAMRRSRKLAWFCRARVGVGPRGILTGGADGAISRLTASFAAAVELSGAGVDEVWAHSSVGLREDICAGRPMSLMLDVARTETLGISRRRG